MAWFIPREWPGETAYIVAGGTSLIGCDLTRLHGRRVIAINSSFERVPFADVLFFGDGRWWRHNRAALADFPGAIVTTAEVFAKRVHPVRCYEPTIGLSDNPDGVAMGRTSLHGAINLAVLYGARRLVLLGADMHAAPDGRTHHHTAHPWPQNPGCWDEQIEFLRYLVEPLDARGIEVINASPTSLIPWWAKCSPDEALSLL